MQITQVASRARIQVNLSDSSQALKVLKNAQCTKNVKVRSRRREVVELRLQRRVPLGTVGVLVGRRTVHPGPSPFFITGLSLAECVEVVNAGS